MGLHGRTCIVALGISTEGDKLALGVWDGSTENATVAGALLADLVDRGLDLEQGLLFVIDGSKRSSGERRGDMRLLNLARAAASKRPCRPARRPQQPSAPVTRRCRSSPNEPPTAGTQRDCSDREGAVI